MKRDHTVTLSRWELEELERKAEILDSLIVLEEGKPVLQRVVGTVSDFMHPTSSIHKFIALRNETVNFSDVRRIYIVDEDDRVVSSYSLVPRGIMNDGATIQHLTDFTHNQGGTDDNGIRSRKPTYEN